MSRSLLPCALTLLVLWGCSSGSERAASDATPSPPVPHTPAPEPAPPPAEGTTAAPEATPGAGDPGRPPPAERLAAPDQAHLDASSGSQRGAPMSHCWTEGGGGRALCVDTVPPSQDRGLAVGSGELVGVRIGADTDPDDAHVTLSRGELETARVLEPERRTSFYPDVGPGRWEATLCATWEGHGTVCWYFLLEVG